MFPVVTTILVIMGLMALTTHVIGVHTVLGAFVAGVLIGESPILSKHIDEQLVTLWDEHRAERARIRFGERDDIVRRARQEERLERAA